MTRTDQILREIPPADLTIGHCLDADFSVTTWCDGRCYGRDLTLRRLHRWAGRKLLDLMRDGVIVCSRCDRPAVAVSVTCTMKSDGVLFWQIGDDAMASAEPPGGRGKIWSIPSY